MDRLTTVRGSIAQEQPVSQDEDQSPLTNEELAAQAATGDMASFEILARRLQGPLLAFLRARTPTQSDAEDLVQDTFLRAYRNLHRYQPTGKFSTWLFTIGHRLSVNRHRRWRPQLEPTADVGVVESRAESALDRVVRAETKQHLWQLADQVLAPKQRDALWLFHGQQLSIQEVAEILSHTTSAVKVMLHRARRKLCKHASHLLADGATAEAETASEPMTTSVDRERSPPATLPRRQYVL